MEKFSIQRYLIEVEFIGKLDACKWYEFLKKRKIGKERYLKIKELEKNK